MKHVINMGEKMQQKHIRLTERDCKNLTAIKRNFDCVSENETIRTALRIAAGVKS